MNFLLGPRGLGTFAYTHFVQLDLLIPNIYHMPIFDQVK